MRCRVGCRRAAASTRHPSTATVWPRRASVESLAQRPRAEYRRGVEGGSAAAPRVAAAGDHLPRHPRRGPGVRLLARRRAPVDRREPQRGWASTVWTWCTCTTPTITRPTRSSTAFPTLIELRDAGCDRPRRVRHEPGRDAVALRRRRWTSTACCWPVATRCSTAVARRCSTQCAAQGVDVIIGGVFNSGLLARPEVGATFDYAAAAARIGRAGAGHAVGVRGLRRGPARRRDAVRAAASRGAHRAGRRPFGGRDHRRRRVRDASLPDELWPALESATL